MQEETKTKIKDLFNQTQEGIKQQKEVLKDLDSMLNFKIEDILTNNK